MFKVPMPPRYETQFNTDMQSAISQRPLHQQQVSSLSHIVSNEGSSNLPLTTPPDKPFRRRGPAPAPQWGDIDLPQSPLASQTDAVNTQSSTNPAVPALRRAPLEHASTIDTPLYIPGSILTSSKSRENMSGRSVLKRTLTADAGRTLAGSSCTVTSPLAMATPSIPQPRQPPPSTTVEGIHADLPKHSRKRPPTLRRPTFDEISAPLAQPELTPPHTTPPQCHHRYVTMETPHGYEPMSSHSGQRDSLAAIEGGTASRESRLNSSRSDEDLDALVKTYFKTHDPAELKDTRV